MKKFIKWLERTKAELEKSRSESMVYDAAVCLTFRELRREKRCTQVQTANFLGVTFQQVQKYECGINRISSGNLFRLYELFDISAAEFQKRLNKNLV